MLPVDTKARTTEQILALIVLGLLLVGCFVVLRPFVSSLMWSILLCFATWPLYSRLLNLLGGRRTLAAFVMTLSIALVLLAPFVLIGSSLADDVASFASRVHLILSTGLPALPTWVERVPLIGHRARVRWEDLASDRSKLVTELRRWSEPVAGWLLVLAGQLGRGLIELGMSIFIAFFLYRDGPSAANRLTLAIERMAGEQARQLLDLAARTVRGVVYGVLGTAIAQSAIAGIGFVIAGIPGAGFLALLTFFLSVVPVGPPLVWIPSALWLFYRGWTGWGIFMLVWGMIVSSVDNVVKPLIISSGSEIPFVLILLGVLGGAAAFGFIGVFIGPTLLAVGFRMLEQWNAGGASALTELPV